MAEPAAERLRREQQFHDDRFTDETRQAAGKYYSVTRASNERFLDALSFVPDGGRALECGCGLDDTALTLGGRGVHVTAIDISPVAIEQFEKRVAAAGLSDRVEGRVMNAEALEFDDGSLDLVFGTGILHHLNLAGALPEIARVLKPTGRAVFIEPLGRNPVINLYRRLTPRMRTPDEHPLIGDDFDLARRWFGGVDVQPFHALSLLAVPARRTRHFSGALDALDRADAKMFAAVPRTTALAWTCVLDLSEPRLVASR
jgi:SAM-dependent methyltransferase